MIGGRLAPPGSQQGRGAAHPSLGVLQPSHAPSPGGSDPPEAR